MNNAKNLLLSALLASPAAAQGGLTLPPSEPDAGGANVPNLGMHHIKQDGGVLPSQTFFLPAGTIPAAPGPLGWVIQGPGIWTPDKVPPGGDQAALDAILTIATDDEYPQELTLTNTDPSGSLDGTAVDALGDPIHFNLHWPPEPPEPFWLEDVGLDPRSPTEDLQSVIDDVLATGSKDRVQEGIDILLGTNESGALTNKAYLGFDLIHIYGRKDNQTFDETTRNIEVTQLWYGTEIYTDATQMLVPTHGDYTITWKIRGLGDPGPKRRRAFPIDEVAPMIMKKVGNSLFWKRNSWIWKWFDVVVDPHDGRKFSLESMYELHTGTPFTETGEPVPTYADVNPGDPRYWLHVNRKFDFGAFVGQDDITDLTAWQSTDLDLDGRVGGYLADGTDTGSAYDAVDNASAQFNSYGVNEYAVPMVDWSTGPYDMPYFSYDSSFATIRKGQGFDLTIRYGQGAMQAGIYMWGWRIHPPRINWIETYSPGQMLPSGAPKDWRFGHKWDEVEALGLDAIGDNAPEKVIYTALVEFDQSAGTQADVDAFAARVDGMLDFIRHREGLPPTPGVANFPDPAADINFLFTNLDMYADRQTIAAAGKGSWVENDVITITVHNDDKVTRFFRVVDFGTTDYQYNGTDMGRLDWKPVFGFPQIAASAWSGLFGAQGYDTPFWNGSELEGTGNPFYVHPDLPFQAPLMPFPGLDFEPSERDLLHHYNSLLPFSGPGFHNVQEGVFTIWGNNQLAFKQTGDPNIWAWSYGAPVHPGETRTFHVEMPRAMSLNNGAMYMFDPQFHSHSIYTMHPVSEVKPEHLKD